MVAVEVSMTEKIGPKRLSKAKQQMVALSSFEGLKLGEGTIGCAPVEANIIANT